MATDSSGSSSEMALQQCLCVNCSIAELFEAKTNYSCRLINMLKCFWTCRYDLLWHRNLLVWDV